MPHRGWITLLAAVALGAGSFAAGRASVDRGAAYRQGESAGYVSGVRDGRAEGVQEGRALQEPLSLPKGSRSAARASFNAGYVAGADDVFGGYDGGWALGKPYVVTLEQAPGPVTYRIASRALVKR
jgi:hypothetical protein